MKVSKTITINLQNYQSLKIGVDEAPDFEAADAMLIDEIKRLGLRVDDKIRKSLQLQNSVDDWM